MQLLMQSNAMYYDAVQSLLQNVFNKRMGKVITDRARPSLS